LDDERLSPGVNAGGSVISTIAVGRRHYLRGQKVEEWIRGGFEWEPNTEWQGHCLGKLEAS